MILASTNLCRFRKRRDEPLLTCEAPTLDAVAHVLVINGLTGDGLHNTRSRAASRILAEADMMTGGKRCDAKMLQKLVQMKGVMRE